MPRTYPTKQQLAERKSWAAQFSRCMACGNAATWMPLQTHEIVRRSQAPGRWCHVANFLQLCEPCHSERFANVTLAPYAAQLAIKYVFDRDNYNLEEFIRILGRASFAVTYSEVNLCISALALRGIQ